MMMIQQKIYYIYFMLKKMEYLPQNYLEDGLQKMKLLEISL